MLLFIIFIGINNIKRVEKKKTFKCYEFLFKNNKKKNKLLLQKETKEDNGKDLKGKQKEQKSENHK